MEKKEKKKIRTDFPMSVIKEKKMGCCFEKNQDNKEKRQ